MFKMRAIVIFASLMAIALARPDVSHLAQAQGYTYTGPNSGSTATRGSYSSNAGYSGGNNQFAGSSNNYNTQEYQGGSSGSTASSNVGGYSGSAQQFGGQGGQGAQSYQSSSNSFSPSSSGSYASQSTGATGGSFGGQFNTGSSAQSYSAGSSGGANLIQGQSQSIDLTGGSSGDRVVYKPIIKQGEPIITKNFYVHAAPEEDENVRVEEKVQIVRPQKSYKIIFIKAPSAGSQFSGANYPVFPQNEEKTIVYVLSKKDESVSEFGEIPTPPPAVTHKPEVYFIKYKTKQEAAQAVANIQAQYKGESSASSGSSAFGSDSSNFGATGGGNFGATSGGNFGATGGGNFGATGGSNFGATGGNFGASNSGSYSSSSSGSSNFGASSTGITPQDFRGEDGGTDDENLEIASFLPNNNNVQSSNFQSSSSSSQTSFGPSGGQISIQASALGPSGGSSISQSQQFDASGQTQQQSTLIGNGNEIIPQNLIRVDDEAAFAGRQNYLPPKCFNC